MKNNYLYKKDALFELYPLEEGYDFFSINITHKTDRGNFYGKWFDFQPELDELHITDVGGDDDWICDGTSREILKSKLEDKGFTVKLM